jgi:hypothetical protein
VEARAVLGAVEVPVTIAVDWSGAVRAVRRKLWLAEVRGGSLVRLECGRDRNETVAHLARVAAREPRVVVGLDFAFSFPAWFLRERGIACARNAWALASREGEAWLARCEPPFWGRKGCPRPPADPERSPFRLTEGERLPVRGIGPKSVFQIGGAGAVGTGSLRGMPKLLALREAGFSIWPFVPPRLPMAVEIYPRWLTGRVHKRSALARRLFLASRAGDQDREIVDRAGSNEDAFDAAVSALAMAEHARGFLDLPRIENPTFLLEGRIWRPSQDPLWGPA